MEAGELERLRRLLTRVAGEAAGLLRDNACSEEYSATVRGETIRADLEAEAYIIDALKAEGFRGLVVSEETGRVELGGDEYVAIVDPLDGSSNYSACIPWASVSIALARRGHGLREGLLAGVVYPVFYGQPVSFARGLGCFLGGRRVEPPRAPSNVMYTYMESSDFVGAVLKAFEALGRPKIRSLGSAALELSYTALGRGLVFIDLRGKLRNVDIAAAYGIVVECGGDVFKPGCGALDAGTESVERVESLIASGNREVACKVARILGGGE
ncbi:inositol monophosphatase family protein [Stetteria hydrogenophila]